MKLLRLSADQPLSYTVMEYHIHYEERPNDYCVRHEIGWRKIAAEVGFSKATVQKVLSH